MVLALPPGGKGLRTLQCLDCERPDPITSPQTIGWLAGELGRTMSADSEKASQLAAFIFGARDRSPAPSLKFGAGRNRPLANWLGHYWMEHDFLPLYLYR